MTTKNVRTESNLIDAKFERVLVILNPGLVNIELPQSSTLLMRAVALAKATGCELELFHVCDDPSLRAHFFSSEAEIRAAQEHYVNRDASLVAELALLLQSEGVTIHHDVRWDHPRTDAILRKIDDAQPDLVMKQSREYGFVMGMLSNVDWDLIRQSPASLWFVTHGQTCINRLATAVGVTNSDQEMFAAADYRVFRVANLIADQFQAENIPVHAYQVPAVYSSYAPEFSGMTIPPETVASEEETRRDIAHRHGQSIEAFAQYFDLDRESVQIVEGHPSDVLTETAKSLKADLIVMAARNLSHWERLFQSVTAEPVLAESVCDVLFVKDGEGAGTPSPTDDSIQGIPAFNLETAITDPELIFGMPQNLVNATEISVALKRRILLVWEHDVRARESNEGENEAARKVNAQTLRDVSLAKANLEVIGERPASETPALPG
jgi:nucleotide-binding universal stress UspA family protein